MDYNIIPFTNFDITAASKYTVKQMQVALAQRFKGTPVSLKLKKDFFLGREGGPKGPEEARINNPKNPLEFKPDVLFFLLQGTTAYFVELPSGEYLVVDKISAVYSKHAFTVTKLSKDQWNSLMETQGISTAEPAPANPLDTIVNTQKELKSLLVGTPLSELKGLTKSIKDSSKLKIYKRDMICQFSLVKPRSEELEIGSLTFNQKIEKNTSMKSLYFALNKPKGIGYLMKGTYIPK